MSKPKKDEPVAEQAQDDDSTIPSLKSSVILNECRQWSEITSLRWKRSLEKGCLSHGLREKARLYSHAREFHRKKLHGRASGYPTASLSDEVDLFETKTGRQVDDSRTGSTTLRPCQDCHILVGVNGGGAKSAVIVEDSWPPRAEQEALLLAFTPDEFWKFVESSDWRPQTKLRVIGGCLLSLLVHGLIKLEKTGRIRGHSEHAYLNDRYWQTAPMQTSSEVDNHTGATFPFPEMDISPGWQGENLKVKMIYFSRLKHDSVLHLGDARKSVANEEERRDNSELPEVAIAHRRYKTDRLNLDGRHVIDARIKMDALLREIDICKLKEKRAEIMKAQASSNAPGQDKDKGGAKGAKQEEESKDKKGKVATNGGPINEADIEDIAEDPFLFEDNRSTIVEMLAEKVAQSRKASEAIPSTRTSVFRPSVLRPSVLRPSVLRPSVLGTTLVDKSMKTKLSQLLEQDTSTAVDATEASATPYKDSRAQSKTIPVLEHDSVAADQTSVSVSLIKESDSLREVESINTLIKNSQGVSKAGRHVIEEDDATSTYIGSMIDLSKAPSNFDVDEITADGQRLMLSDDALTVAGLYLPRVSNQMATEDRLRATNSKRLRERRKVARGVLQSAQEGLTFDLTDRFKCLARAKENARRRMTTNKCLLPWRRPPERAPSGVWGDYYKDQGVMEMNVATQHDLQRHVLTRVEHPRPHLNRDPEAMGSTKLDKGGKKKGNENANARRSGDKRVNENANAKKSGNKKDKEDENEKKSRRNKGVEQENEKKSGQKTGNGKENENKRGEQKGGEKENENKSGNQKNCGNANDKQSRGQKKCTDDENSNMSGNKSRDDNAKTKKNVTAPARKRPMLEHSNSSRVVSFVQCYDINHDPMDKDVSTSTSVERDVLRFPRAFRDVDSRNQNSSFTTVARDDTGNDRWDITLPERSEVVYRNNGRDSAGDSSCQQAIDTNESANIKSQRVGRTTNRLNPLKPAVTVKGRDNKPQGVRKMDASIPHSRKMRLSFSPSSSPVRTSPRPGSKGRRHGRSRSNISVQPSGGEETTKKRPATMIPKQQPYPSLCSCQECAFDDEILKHLRPRIRWDSFTYPHRLGHFVRTPRGESRDRLDDGESSGGRVSFLALSQEDVTAEEEQEQRKPVPWDAFLERLMSLMSRYVICKEIISTSAGKTFTTVTFDKGDRVMPPKLLHTYVPKH